ncbi:phosphotransferase [Streptomyces sp. DSM 44915]|uniref:Phosphotransferase n=1 Tax=Streptomyces chisholmiae TaxID=3075540 RepID=A0ABU2JPB0_9ACTN|nr:phosphotransferase [Streptomyces sp. DSM 44915]MDT0266831.1 phosphotransferase [Streptomyces sp. DSM 44915]
MTGASNAVVAGNRLPWPEAPHELTGAVGELLGSPIIRHQTQWGGFSAGIASRVRCANGRPAFVKAVERTADEFATMLYERESAIAVRLPGTLPAPRCLGVVRERGWLALVFEDAGASAVELPWDDRRLDRVTAQLTRLTALATPSPVSGLEPWGGDLADWRNWAALTADGSAERHLPPRWRHGVATLAALEAGLEEARAGETLLHSDLRSDNIIIRPDGGVVFVDWAQAAVGAAWIDPLIFALCAAVQGAPDPDRLLAAHPAGHGAPAELVNRVLAALAGRFAVVSTTPGPPAVRSFQRLESEVVLRWLDRRLT